MEKTCANPKAIEVEISDSSAVTGDIEKKNFRHSRVRNREGVFFYFEVLSVTSLMKLKRRLKRNWINGKCGLFSKNISLSGWIGGLWVQQSPLSWITCGNQ